ncbi:MULTISPECIES: helix-turn-helix transcriptional regulator [unclassified Solwaraspora]|uniref:helix-turn-helix domain-containing protein n=1 Tax=unclassified Solwaraspora TaxID=2627926 RepID=UPI00248CA2B3|nr:MULTISPECIES: helix-turn-helix transcriptional regulator [unclassified Solwaraspora]WBB96560.1 helix-turn-helix transcriptional regulator [Solwaraspora sp. WMMA2059]WBC19535.1 helix-turn-helix transcriptional regulator [Solwaraspora sp. WMMA2080]WJK32881.1 helix-turn-helix transcriptional regulator [Solwaraspora sp. WMMA2065]
MNLSDLKTSAQVHDEQRHDPEFCSEWDRTAFANDVALRILRYRQEHGLTQAGLAREVGMTQSVIARLESGDQPPSIATLVKLSKGTGMDFNIKVSGGAVEFIAA